MRNIHERVEFMFIIGRVAVMMNILNGDNRLGKQFLQMNGTLRFLN